MNVKDSRLLLDSNFVIILKSDYVKEVEVSFKMSVPIYKLFFSSLNGTVGIAVWSQIQGELAEECENLAQI